jgi:cytochrome c oxidase subunit 2
MMQMGELHGGSRMLSAWELLGQSGSFWLPPPAATSADVVDSVFQLILAVCTVFFVLIVGLMVLFVIMYRRRDGVEASDSPSHNTALEIMWTAVPVAISMVIFYYGFKGYLDLRTPPLNAYEVQVFAQKWSWTFQYPNGVVSEELHVPVDRPVRVVLSSQDVIHSFFVPAFRIKMDAVPGRYNQTWFQARTEGKFDIYCAEYCGSSDKDSQGHSSMLSKVVVHAPGEFENWLEDQANVVKRLPPAQAGEELYKRYGCAACHSTDGSARTGPSFKGIWGETHEFSNSTPTKVDENYLRESILEPMKKIRSGFQGVMPTFQGRFKNDQEIRAIIEFIKSLK